MNLGPTPKEAIGRLRLKLEALKNGEGIPESRQGTPEQMRGHYRWIETYLNRAEEELENLRSENLDFVKVLIHAAEYRWVIALYTPHIMSDEKRLAGLRKPRKPEIDKWMDRQLSRDSELKSPEAWRRAPEWITDDIGYDRFAKRMTKARKRRKEKPE